MVSEADSFKSFTLFYIDSFYPTSCKVCDMWLICCRILARGCRCDFGVNFHLISIFSAAIFETYLDIWIVAADM